MAVVPRIGTEFAGYRIEALLGRGGMSVVYRAENARLGNKVALKLLAEELASNESFRERFVRESRTAATLNHPNVITIYDAGDEDGVLYIAMRYVESDLKQLLGREGRLSPTKTLAIVAQIASALDAAHGRGLLHRDVKPANILLDLTSEPGAVPHAYLADFGLTKHLESRSGITASGQFVGTIDYMSPEQIEGRDVDGRTDIYSLGCVLFECLAGTTPYRRETEVAVLWAHMRDPPPAVTELRPELPGAVDLVIARAVDKDPAKRYATARELVEEVQAALEGVPEAQTRLGRPPAPAATPVADAPPPAGARSFRRGRLRVAAVGLLALLIGAAAGIAVYEAIRDVEPRVIGQRGTRFNAYEEILARALPYDSCQRTQPPTPDFVAGFVCREPAPRVTWVNYYLAASAFRLGPHIQNSAEGQGLNADGRALLPEGSCSVPPGVFDWRRRGTAGHRIVRPDERDAHGRVLCYRGDGWAALEWTDRDASVYAVAFGTDLIRLRTWWEDEAGPEPGG